MNTWGDIQNENKRISGDLTHVLIITLREPYDRMITHKHRTGIMCYGSTRYCILEPRASFLQGSRTVQLLFSWVKLDLRTPLQIASRSPFSNNFHRFYGYWFQNLAWLRWRHWLMNVHVFPYSIRIFCIRKISFLNLLYLNWLKWPYRSLDS